MSDIIERLRATPETGADPDLIFEAADEIERLRRMLAIAYSGAHLYCDDGELQDGRLPVIDFRRDSAEEIERKIHERGMKALAARLTTTNA